MGVKTFRAHVPSSLLFTLHQKGLKPFP